VYADRPIEDLPPGLYGQRARLDGSHRDPDRIRRVRALYYGLVSHVDDCVGRILSELDDLGIADNTAILFVSDHGEMLGDHGIGQKFCPYEHSVRIPFLLRWPGQTEARRVSDDLVSLLDFYPTLIDQLDLPYDGPEELPGATLLGKPGGGLTDPRSHTVIDFGHAASLWISIRSQTKKLSLFANGDVEEAYDLGTDPWEQRPLQTATWIDEYRQQLLNWDTKNGTPESTVSGRYTTFPAPETPAESDSRNVVLNEGTWPNRLPDDEANSIEPFSEAFTKIVSKEPSLSPDKLSLDLYKHQVESTDRHSRGTDPLTDTPWEDTYNNA